MNIENEIMELFDEISLIMNYDSSQYLLIEDLITPMVFRNVIIIQNH